MRTEDFDYFLPTKAIAQQPLPRGESRLLVVDAEGAERHRRVRDLPLILEAGDLLVVNDTRVIPARLYGQRATTGGKVELLLVEQTETASWWALGKAGNPLRPGTRIELDEGVVATVVERGEGGQLLVRFAPSIEPYLEEIGHIPLPPYIERPDQASDRERYQTVYARHPGAVAAPTAGLHFTPELLSELERTGIEITALTLHVGPGTFRPVKVDNPDLHVMHSEPFSIAADAADRIERARREGRRIVAVGTTVVRALKATALMSGGTIEAIEARTDLFIRPGFEFRVVDRLLTNFHLPKSTLLMLVSGLAGRGRTLAAYREAVREGYRFYSYGDAMLVSRSAD